MTSFVHLDRLSIGTILVYNCLMLNGLWVEKILFKKEECRMKIKGLTTVGVLVLFAAAGCATAERAPGLDRGKFHISCFSFNKPAQTRAHIRQAKECGLNIVSGGIFPDDCPEFGAFAEEGLDVRCIYLPRVCGGGQKSEDLRRKYPREKLEAMLDAFNAKHAGNPAIRMMNVSDEPGVPSMAFLGDVVRLVEEKCPQLRAYVNLFPNYAQAAESETSVKVSQLGTTSYKKYIDEYCRLVPTKFISYDHYPIFRTAAQTRQFAPRWYGNLKVVADACRRTGRDLWVGPQANSRVKCPPITENHLRYQAFSAMAFGAVDLTWACWTLGWWDNNLMETNGTLTCQYPKLKTVNAEVRTLAEHYMKLRNVATHFVGFADEKEGLAQYEIVPVRSVSASGVTDLAAADGSSLVVGEMVARDPASAVRGLFVYGANDCADERRETHVVTFVAKGKVRAFGPNGPVDVKSEAGGRYSFDLADNSAVLVLVR